MTREYLLSKGWAALVQEDKEYWFCWRPLACGVYFDVAVRMQKEYEERAAGAAERTVKALT